MGKQPNRSKNALLLGAVLVVAGGSGGWMVLRDTDPLSAAIEQVDAGKLEEGCTALEAAAAEAPAEVKITCVTHRIDTALADPDAVSRERRLLALAAPSATFPANDAQLARIDAEVATLPGAIVKGLGRFHPFRYEVQGPVATRDVRKLVRALDIPMRACHALTATGEADVEGQYYVDFFVAADGQVGKVTPGGKEISPVQNAELTACLGEVFAGQMLPSQDRASRFGIDMRLRPFSSGS